MSFEAVLIAGPTASGKSALALALARTGRFALVNADSMQVYREIRVLSARPSADEEATAPHLLFGFVSVLAPFSVARWVEAAASARAEIRGGGLTPIFVGGTGLYFHALQNGLSPIPAIAPETRAAVRAQRDALGAAAFYADLVARDPSAEALNANDTQRVLRAAEVLEETGEALSAWQSLKGEAVLDPARCLKVVLAPPRETLYARCDARFDAMMADGALEEARAIQALGLDPAMPAARALGLSHLARHLSGEIPLDQAVAEAKRDTRRYAKRQMTWFRRFMADWRAEPDPKRPGLIQELLTLFEQG